MRKENSHMTEAFTPGDQMLSPEGADTIYFKSVGRLPMTGQPPGY